MIKGGSNGTLQAGNIRSGYSDLFIPAKVYAIPESIIKQYNSSKGIPYTFKVYVKNTGDWVNVGDAVSFSITINPNGNFNTASLQVKNTVKWGIAGTENPDLLKPGNTKIKITGSCEGVPEFAFFIGRITKYDRSEAFGASAISLQATDERSILQRLPLNTYEDNQTVYRHIKRQLQTTLKDYGITYAPQVKQDEGTYQLAGSKYTAVNASINGQPFWIITSSGNLIITSSSSESKATDVGGEMLTLSDSNILQLSRIDNEFATYNTVKIAGYENGEYKISSVQNDADVAIRGNVWYAPGVIGTPTCQLSESEEVANRMLAQIFNPAFNADVPFFPFFEAGTRIKMFSSRFNLEPSYAYIGKITHQFSFGQTSTTLSGLYTEAI